MDPDKETLLAMCSSEYRAVARERLNAATEVFGLVLYALGVRGEQASALLNSMSTSHHLAAHELCLHFGTWQRKDERLFDQMATVEGGNDGELVQAVNRLFEGDYRLEESLSEIHSVVHSPGSSAKEPKTEQDDKKTEPGDTDNTKTKRKLFDDASSSTK